METLVYLSIIYVIGFWVALTMAIPEKSCNPMFCGMFSWIAVFGLIILKLIRYFFGRFWA